MSAQTAGPRPNLFIIGAPKCGTTSLYEYLKGHPQVYMSAAKEPGYFAPDTRHGSHQLRYGEDEERYLALFADAGRAKRVGEATVGYIYSSVAPGLIHEFDASARVIAMFRDPVDMIHSFHNQRLSEGRETNADFGRVIAAELNAPQVPPQSQGQETRLGRATYLDRALYSRYLPRWLEMFGPEQVHVVILEDLERHAPTEFRRVLEFLGVDPAYQPQSFQAHNKRHQPRSNLLRRLRKSPPMQWIAWQLMPRLVGDSNARRLVRGFLYSPLNRRVISRPALDATLRRQLEEYYAPDVARLSEILGRDLASLWWGRPARPSR